MLNHLHALILKTILRISYCDCDSPLVRIVECLNPFCFLPCRDSHFPDTCHLKLLRIYYNAALESSHT